MHDLVEYETRGIPSVMVASSEFVGATKHQADALGLRELAAQAVFVTHPIQGISDEEVRKKARTVFDDIVKGLTTGHK